MDGERRRRLARKALEGYANGPDATLEAIRDALERAGSARSVVLVEGISDQIAVETLAERRGWDLQAESIVVVPMGGAQAMARNLARFGPKGADLAVAALCDAGEADHVRRALVDSGLGSPQNRIEMEQLGFFVCERDLEDELIRAAGPEAIETLLDSQGDMGSFQTLQKQPEWRDQHFDGQMHRWLRAGARRNLRYARLLVRASPLDRMPRPLEAVLAAAVDPRGR